MQRENKTPFYACPHCLTEISLKEDLPISLDEPEPEIVELAEPEIKADDKGVVEEAFEEPVESSGCPHHIGYLSERSSKGQIPDECIMCKDIVACMLKRMKD
jgi:hypothetical protein